MKNLKERNNSKRRKRSNEQCCAKCKFCGADPVFMNEWHCYKYAPERVEVRLLDDIYDQIAELRKKND